MVALWKMMRGHSILWRVAAGLLLTTAALLPAGAPAIIPPAVLTPWQE